MSKFYVAKRMDNSGTILIGYQVLSRSRFGGERYHGGIQAQHPESLERAKARCEEHAKNLQEEADASRARRKATGQG